MHRCTDPLFPEGALFSGVVAENGTVLVPGCFAPYECVLLVISSAALRL
jgi:hypothetical protein